MKRIVFFASGSGSNVENIATYFKGRNDIEISAVLTNRKDAHVLERCERLQLNALYFNRQSFYHSDLVLKTLKAINPHLIVLAGFLWKVPEAIIEEFPNRIINIHPALLPKYGGKGMYGIHVHKAVKESGDAVSGITIHYVNAQYDEGAIIRQVTIAVDGSDTPENIADKVHQLEYQHYPLVIEELLQTA